MGTTAAGDRAATFEAERARLTGLAYRMLGSWAEAEDAVQNAWLRFAREDEVRDPSAFLTTVVARLCLDVLRSARVRREAYVGPWLPEPLVERLPAAAPDPADVAAERDDLGFALLVLLERLTPEQRVAFVLHDVFAVPFDRVATALATTPEAARQLASRARRAVAHADRLPARPAEQARLVTAFLAAVRTGDLDALLAVLAPDVEMIGDGGGLVPAGRRPVTGAVAAARFLLSWAKAPYDGLSYDVEPVLVNGEPGLLWEVHAPAGSTLPAPRGAPPLSTMRVVMALRVDGGRITAIYDQLNPTKLAQVPSIAEMRAR
jgi:RNA polymerase sigma-70 factor (ECF subfamily)